MNEPIETTPVVLKKYALVDYVFQFITVTAGVLIALLINGLVEWNHNRELVADARATIAREIADNKQDLDATLSTFGKDQKQLADGIKFASDMLATGKTSVTALNFHLNLADLSSAAWRTAERTAALSHMDYAEVQRYSKLYDLQDLYVEQQRSLLGELGSATALLAGDFNPDKPNAKDLELFRERLMHLSARLRLQEDFGKTLAERYAETLKH